MMLHEWDKTWLIVGSSPSVTTFVDPALACVGERGQTMTTNSGWQLFATAESARWPRPDYYLLSDPIAIEAHARAAGWMRHRGTRIVGRVGMNIRGVPVDDQIDLADYAQRDPWQPGTFVNGRTSGTICVQFAVNRGARVVVIIGMDGYLSSPGNVVRETFDARMGKASGSAISREWQVPLLQQIVTASPQITFVLAGHLSYSLHGDNVIMARTVERLEEIFAKELIHE